MKRNIKKAALIVCCALAFSGLYGCGREAEPVNTEISAEDPEDGKGDIIEEEPAEDADEEAVINTLALRGPSYTGLSNLANTNNEDGS